MHVHLEIFIVFSDYVKYLVWILALYVFVRGKTHIKVSPLFLSGTFLHVVAF